MTSMRVVMYSNVAYSAVPQAENASCSTAQTVKNYVQGTIKMLPLAAFSFITFLSSSSLLSVKF